MMMMGMIKIVMIKKIITKMIKIIKMTKIIKMSKIQMIQKKNQIILKIHKNLMKKIRIQ